MPVVYKVLTNGGVYLAFSEVQSIGSLGIANRFTGNRLAHTL